MNDETHREVCLQEWVTRLPPSHRARKEWAELMQIAKEKAGKHVSDDAPCHAGLLPKEKCCRCSSILSARNLLDRITEYQPHDSLPRRHPPV